MAFLFNWFVKITAGLVQLFVFRTKIYYEDKAVQSNKIKGKAIVMSNHNYLMDFAAMLFVFWRRTLHCVTAEVMYQKNFFMTAFLNLSGAIKVERDAKDFSFLPKCRRILDKGGVVEIYPEARLPELHEETPLEFKPSVVYLALESGAPIIPVYTNGSYFSKERTRVIIGKPISVAELYDDSKTEKENIADITIYLRGRIIELRDELDKQKRSDEEKKKA